ncbi:MAG: class I SAM-dependent methyltransferase [Bacteroidota bacterium]
MSEIIYGLISPVDKKTMEKCFDEIFEKFPDAPIRYCECGLYNGRTTSGAREYFKSKNKKYIQIGIDNFKDKEELVFFPEDAKLIFGSSIEVYNQLPDESQHFIMIDGNHSKPYVMADALCYYPKLKVGGFICFHDAAPHAQDVSYQRMGSEDDLDMSISVLRALERIGWIGEYNVLDFYGLELAYYEYAPFEVDEGGGVIIFKRIR